MSAPTEPPVPEPLALHHLAVVVRDLDRVTAFYRDVLGLPEIRRWTDDAGAPRSVWLAMGSGAFLAVEKAAEDAPERAGAPGFHCVALAIEPSRRAAWRDRLGAAGIAVVRESPFTIYVHDPEENLVGLSHYPSAEGP
jgi:glyoxylase I family protein